MGLGHSLQCCEAPLTRVQALPVWWLREPGALAEDPSLTISTQCTMRKPKIRSSKARGGRIRINFATHPAGDSQKIHIAFLGESLLDTPCDWKGLEHSGLLLEPALPGGL